MTAIDSRKATVQAVCSASEKNLPLLLARPAESLASCELPVRLKFTCAAQPAPATRAPLLLRRGSVCRRLGREQCGTG